MGINNRKLVLFLPDELIQRLRHEVIRHRTRGVSRVVEMILEKHVPPMPVHKNGASVAAVGTVMIEQRTPPPARVYDPLVDDRPPPDEGPTEEPEF